MIACPVLPASVPYTVASHVSVMDIRGERSINCNICRKKASGKFTSAYSPKLVTVDVTEAQVLCPATHQFLANVYVRNQF